MFCKIEMRKQRRIEEDKCVRKNELERVEKGTERD